MSVDTEALISNGGGAATLVAGAGAVLVKAENKQTLLAKATSKVEKSNGDDSVGVGASVALNIIKPNVTKAEVEDGAALTGGSTVSVEATFFASKLETIAEAGSEGDISVSPAVAITIATVSTTARLGTAPSSLIASGAVSVAAASAAAPTTKADAEAAGADVSVGASVGVAIIEPTTIAAVERGVSGASVAITSNSSFASIVDTTAGSKGEKSKGDGGKNADDEANGQVDNNPSANGATSRDLSSGSSDSATSSVSGGSSQSSGESGQGSSGVGVGASVAVNIVDVNNAASVGAGQTIIASGGPVKVSATNATDAIAKAIGHVLGGESDARVGAGVAVNVTTISNTASIGAGANVTGHGITVEATTPATGTDSEKSSDVIAWGFAAAGGTSGETSVAGSVGVNVIHIDSIASVGTGATLNSLGGSAGDITLTATTKLGLQNLALAAALGEGTAVGAAVAVNVVTITTKAFVDSGASVDATDVLSLAADTSIAGLDIFQTDVPILGNITIGAGAAGGAVSSDSGVAIGGSVVVEVLNLTTQAYLANDVDVNLTAAGSGQSISITANDTTTLINFAGALSASLGGAAIGAGIVVEVITKDTRAYIGHGSDVEADKDVTIRATSFEDIFAISVVIGVSGDNAGIAASIVVVVLRTGARAYIDSSAAAPTTVHAGGNMTIAACDGTTTTIFCDSPSKLDIAAGGGAFGSSTGVGVSTVVFVKKSTVRAYIGIADDPTTGGIDEEADEELAAVNADIEAKGAAGLSVTAKQGADVLVLAIGAAGGQTAGVAGSVVVDVLTDTTKAYIGSGTNVNLDNGGATPGQSVNVTASDTTTVVALAGQLAVGGTAGVGVGVDVEVINKTTEAFVGNDATINALGDITIDATSGETITSVSVGGGFGGTAAVTVNAAVSVINITTRAFVEDGTNALNGATLRAGGSARVAADERLKLDVIAGNISGGGTAAVGASVSVPVVEKHTSAYIGNYAAVSAAGGSGLTVKQGNFDVKALDTRFNGATAVSDDTIDLGPDYRLEYGQEVIYDNGGGTSIGGLSDSNVDIDAGKDGIQSQVYYVQTSDERHVQLSKTRGVGDAIVELSDATGDSHRLVRTDQAGVRKDASPRFDPALHVDYATDTFTVPYDVGFGNDDAVVYSAGGGTAISGLSDGGKYFARNVSGNSFQLYTAKSTDDCGCGVLVAVDAPGPGAGRGHSIVAQDRLPGGDAAAAGPRTIDNLEQTGFRGIAVTATNSDDLAAVGISASISGTAAVAVSGVVTVVNVTTDAHIGDHAKINCAATCASNVAGANGAQSVRVAAANQFYQLGIAATLAIAGSAGVAVPVGVRIVNLDTAAYIAANTSVNAARDVFVTANGKDTAVTVVAGAGGGLVGVAGSVSVTVLNTNTYAYTLDHVAITAGGNVVVAATAPSKIILVVAAIAGGFVGVGAAVGVLSGTKDTRAALGTNNTVTAGACCSTISATIHDGSVGDSSFGTIGSFAGVAVQATSSQNVFGITASAAGGFVGVAVGVGVTILNITTSAAVGDGAIIVSSSAINVSAVDYTKTLTIGGGAAGGFVGVGGGVDIGVVDITVASTVGTGTLTASGDVDVFALSRKNVTTLAISLGVGFVGAAGSVSVWTVGTKPLTTYKDDTNPAEQDPLNTDEGSAAGTADSAATSTPDAWHDGADYKKGDVVRYSGQNYAAKNNISPSTTNPSADGANWAPTNNGGYDSALNNTSGNNAAPASEGKTNTRISGATTQASTKMAAAKPTSGPTSAALANVTPPLGTKASLNATVTSTAGDVRVVAVDRLDFNGIAGTGAAGLVGVGASVLIMNVETVTEAQVGSSANIGAAGVVEVRASQVNEQVHGLAFAAAAGLVAVGGIVVVINDTSSQNAHVDTGAQIRAAGGGIVVRATADRHESALTVGVSVAAVAAGVSISIMNAHGDTTATIGNVAIGTDAANGGPVASLVVDADANISPTASAYAVQAGLLGGLSGAVALVTVDGTTAAKSGAHGPVGNGSTSAYCGGTATGVCVHATGEHGGVEANSFNFVTGAFNLGVTRTSATDARSTEAVVTGGTIGTTGGYNVLAYSTHKAVANAPSASGGLVSLSAMLPTAEISGHTWAKLDGSVSSSTQTTVQASAQHSVTASAFIGSITVIGVSGAFASAEITDTADIDAIVGPSASIASSGAVVVEAIQHGDGNLALATAKAFTGPGVAAGAIIVSKAAIAGRTRAQLGGSVTSSSAVHVHAESANKADAQTIVLVAAAFAGAGSGADSSIGTGATTDALVDSTAMTVSSGGQIHVESKSANTANAVNQAAAGGLFAGALNLPSATIDGATKATFDAQGGSAGSLLVESTGANYAVGESSVVSVGAVALGGAKADAKITSGAAIEALAGSSANTTLTSGGAQVKATGSNIAVTSTQGTSVGVVSLNVFAPTSIVNAGVKATYDGTIGGGNGLTVQARGQNIAFAHANMFSLSIVGGGGSLPDASLGASADTEASIGSSANITVTGAVLVDAGQTPYAANANPSLGSDGRFVGQTNIAFAQSDGAGGGVISVGSYTSNSEVQSSVLAKLDGTISSSSSVEVKANGTNRSTAETGAFGLGIGAAITAGGAGAAVTANADVAATAGSTADITSSGYVRFTSLSHHYATAEADVASGGAVGVGVALPTAEAGGKTTARYDGKITGAIEVTISATGENNAYAKAHVVSIGAFAGGGASSCAVAGSSGGEDCEDKWTVGSTTASVGSTAVFDVPAAAVTVIATGTNVAKADGGSDGGGAVSVTVSDPDAYNFGETTAEFLGSLEHDGGDGALSLDVQAQGTDNVVSTIKTFSIGLIKVGISSSNAVNKSTVAANLGANGSVIRVANDISLKALDTTDADAATDTSGGGALSIDAFTAHASDDPTITVDVKGGTTIVAGDEITISALHNDTGDEVFDGTFDAGAVDTSNGVAGNAIVFGVTHNLKTGDFVTYDRMGGNDVDVLHDTRTYTVVVPAGTDGKRIQLGSTFLGASVDLVKDTIITQAPHNLETGDQVYYWVPTGSTGVAGLTSGSLYTVLKIDDRILKLQTQSTLSVTAQGSNISGNAVNVANSFADGQLVTYRAPRPLMEFSSLQVDQHFDDEDGFVDDNNNQIFFAFDSGDADHTPAPFNFADGTALVYDVSGGPAIGGLTPGNTYYLVNTGDDLQIKLASTLCNALGIPLGGDGLCDNGGDDDGPIGDAAIVTLALNPNKSTAGKAAIHTLSRAADAKIAQLVDGRNYYVFNRSAGSFQLTTAANDGSTLVLITNSGNLGGPHVFAREGVDLTGLGTGEQRLVVNLTAPGSGTQRVIGAGGSAFTTPSVGDGVTTASATGFAIGAIAVQGGSATASSDPTVTLTINGSLTAHDISATTNVVVSVKVSSATDGGGLIGVGDSHATGTAKTTNKLVVAGGAQLTALGDVLLRSRSEFHISGHTDPNIIGFIGVALADTDLVIDWETKTEINGGISAGANATIDARTDIDGFASARAEGAGFGADSDADATLNVGTGSRHGLTRVVFGGTKHVLANTLSANALVERARVTTNAYTRSTAAGAGSTADATSRLEGSNEVILESGSYLIGQENLFLTAQYDHIDVYAYARSICRCFGGYTAPTGTGDLDTTALVDGKDGSTVKTANLVVTAYQNVDRVKGDASRSGAFLDFGSSDPNTSTSAKRHIHWESQTYLLGEPNPVLVIDENGTIVAKTDNVTVRTSPAGTPMNIGQSFLPGQTIYIDPIIYDELPAALFRANEVDNVVTDVDGVIDGTEAVFYMQETWDSVYVENNFDAAIVILANNGTYPGISIATVNQHLTQTPVAVISVSVDSEDFGTPQAWQWDLKHYFPATRRPRAQRPRPAVDRPVTASRSMATSTTRSARRTIENDRGDILVGSSADLHEQQARPRLRARLDRHDRLARSDAILVQWDCTGTLFCSAPHPKPWVLTAEAGVDIYIDLTTLRRDSTTANAGVALAPVIGPIKAGNDLYIKINDSAEGTDAGGRRQRRTSISTTRTTSRAAASRTSRSP